MKMINATFFIKKDKREAFLSDITDLIESSRQEKGCLYYHLYESMEEPNTFVMVETWENQEAIDNHNQNPMLLKLGEKLPEYSEKELDLKISDLIE
ncbi:MAG: antibiotic biosynthesis monooxygenase [Alkalibacterium sp.]|nr:antibiotic biosynthesis monooxygenase [Alkalibacterium sp.]